MSTLVSCSDKKSPAPRVDKKYFVLGDPYQIVAGSQLNPEVSFPDEMIENREYILLTNISFEEKKYEENNLNVKSNSGAKESFEYSEDNQFYKVKKNSQNSSFELISSQNKIRLYKDPLGDFMLFIENIKTNTSEKI
ncbi:MAG: hypothetical protein KDD40_11780, partial [Bdellovibrionales bacterium]|nr:hypothetical protein [Bdellovibrionales bacterium]